MYQTVKICFALYFLLAFSLTDSAKSKTNPDSCPTITITCAKDNDCGCGPEYEFVARISDADDTVQPTYKWTILSGKIVEGEGTDRIKVDASEAKTASITVTLEVGGYNEACPNKASMTNICCMFPPPANKAVNAKF